MTQLSEHAKAPGVDGAARDQSEHVLLSARDFDDARRVVFGVESGDQRRLVRVEAMTEPELADFVKAPLWRKDIALCVNARRINVFLSCTA